jgi:hypothetical protein
LEEGGESEASGLGRLAQESDVSIAHEGARLQHPKLMHETGGGRVIVGSHRFASPAAQAHGDVRPIPLDDQRANLMRDHPAAARTVRSGWLRRCSPASVARRASACAITARMVRARAASLTADRCLAAIGLDHFCMVAFPTARDEPRWSGTQTSSAHALTTKPTD